MIREGDWVDLYGGYGVVVKIFPEYYECWWKDIPDDKAPGEKKQDRVIIKRFCNREFKVYPQTKVMSMDLVSEIEPSDLDRINELLMDEKISRRFEQYRVDNSIGDVINFDQFLSDRKFAEVKAWLDRLENNGNLQMTMMEINSLLKRELDVDVFAHVDKIPRPNCYIQVVSSGLGEYRDKEMLFKKLGIIAKTWVE